MEFTTVSDHLDGLAVIAPFLFLHSAKCRAISNRSDLSPLLQVDLTIELLNDLIALASGLFEFLPIENLH
jgi:hypothetical protein